MNEQSSFTRQVCAASSTNIGELAASYGCGMTTSESEAPSLERGDRMSLNHYKICFVMCVNDWNQANEALYYLERLYIPDGYTTDIVTIEGAKSMTEGYQRAMEDSDAAYKVYLHQDVMIINQNFIRDALSVFAQDEKIGMLGMVGSVELPADAVAWNNNKRCGMLYGNNVVTANITVFPEGITGDYREVECIDGLLMMTRVDMKWRTDLFGGWDFYDVSQSFEMRRAGYKVVVPKQASPWTVHDDGFLNLKDYRKWQKVFLQEYKEEMKV